MPDPARQVSRGGLLRAANVAIMRQTPRCMRSPKPTGDRPVAAALLVVILALSAGCSAAGRRLDRRSQTLSRRKLECCPRPCLCVLSALLLCSLTALSGWAWRAAFSELRGIERTRVQEHGPAQGFNVDLVQYEPQERAHALHDIERLGSRWVRQQFPWREIEPMEGIYDWARWDAAAGAVAGRGLGLIAVLDAPPEWALRRDPTPLPCQPPCRVEAYARFVGAFARRYAGIIQAYQVWDEPNLSQAWGGGHVAACGYASLLKAAYRSIHEADPSAVVLGGGLAPTQASGPADLNDLTYLAQLYTLGGGAYFDVLAVKGYGFWSGPQDRRVVPDVLNFSRLVAVRELMRRRGDATKPLWAVEWGWHVSRPDAGTAAPPWGTDRIETQRPRILGAVERARVEWPWLEVMCWAEYQPDRPPTDPRWGFAVRDPEGQEAPLYAVLQHAARGPSGSTSYHAPQPGRWASVAGSLAIGYTAVGLVWWRLRCGRVVRAGWRWWRARPWRAHLAALAALTALVAVTPWPEWVVTQLALAGTILYLRPRWGLLAAVATVPLFYAAKPLGNLRLAPSEITLYLTAAGAVIRLAGRRPHPLSGLGVAWLAWAAWAGVTLLVAPNPADAWHEWRIAVFAPALLCLLLSVQAAESQADRVGAGAVALTWVLSGAVVASVGIVQWWAGAPVAAGSVGRVTGVYYSPNHLALFLERVWPIALAVALCYRATRWWPWVAVTLVGMGLYLTYSRGAWLLAVPVSLAVLGWYYRRRLRSWVVAAVLAAVLLVASNVVLGRATTPANLLEEIRIHVWRSTVEMIAQHPCLGVGLDGFRPLYPRYMQAAAWQEPVLYHPHNVWLDAAVQTGLPGLALFTALVAFSLRRLLCWTRHAAGWQRALAVGCVAATLGGLAHGLVDSGYFLPDLAWSLGLMGGLAQMAVRQAGIDAEGGL